MSSLAEKLRTRKVRRPQGVVLYEGPSQLDGKPIIVILVGLARRSKNPKTGNMLQTHILRRDVDPIRAKLEGKDSTICGDCPHRELGTCYVNVTQAPLAVWRAWKKRKYPRFNVRKHAALFVGRFLRLGSYGDPAAVPLAVWTEVCGLVEGWTGYTHQWAVCDRGLARYCVASCDTPADREAALAAGWRTFRIRTAEQPLLPGEFVCPASAEAGKRLTCEECRACSGTKAGGRNATPAIIFHGPRIAGDWRAKRFEGYQAQHDEGGRFVRLSLATVN
jgi:hypothetical protein